MHKNLLSICLLFTMIFLNLSGNAQTRSVYDQLVSVNAEWKHQADINEQLKLQSASLLTEQQLIQLHLSETEKLLRSRNVSKLSPQQKRNRLKNLDVLHQYLMAGVFPVNNMHYNRQPYFIDANNTYCAVGYLMKESGADDMARDIHRTQNFSYLEDIHHKKLMNWVQQSGLSFDELALIQPGYPGDLPATLLEFHYNNIGTDVNEYIEVRQGAGLGGKTFNTVLFYKTTGELYKTLPIADMKSNSSNHPPMYYYMFSTNESFADSGRIELWHQYNDASSYLVSEITYNADSVAVKDYFYSSASRTYQIGENESTPINTSLTFCGSYFTIWTLSSLPATIGTVNPCINLIVPIILSDFSFAVNQNKVNLFWETLTETNNKQFVIERSADGIHFNQIGMIPVSGNSSSAKQYAYTDNKPQYINYYRLKQVDINGTFSYSKVLYVKVDQASPLVLLQTVVNSDLNYQNNLLTTGSKIDIYDITGRRMYSNPAGIGSQHINVSNITSGKYILRLSAVNGQVYTRQFMKQ